MQKTDKIRITQQEIDDVYDITKEEEITEETLPIEESRETITTKKGDTTPDIKLETVLSEEEQEYDDAFFEAIKEEDDLQ